MLDKGPIELLWVEPGLAAEFAGPSGVQVDLKWGVCSTDVNVADDPTRGKAIRPPACELPSGMPIAQS